MQDIHNFPTVEELTPETGFFLHHPLAVFDLRSRFCHFRSMMDHAQVFERFFGLTREKYTGERWEPAGAEERIEAPALALAAAGDDETLAIDPLAPNERLDVEIRIPTRGDFEHGEAIFTARGGALVPGRPVFEAIVPREEQEALRREDPSLPEDPEALMRAVFSNDATRNHFHAARILARLPSMWGWVDDERRIRFSVPVPKGSYTLLHGDWVVLVTDRTPN